jgi:hypothetical protein
VVKNGQADAKYAWRCDSAISHAARQQNIYDYI